MHDGWSAERTKEVISLPDNADDGFNHTSSTSSAIVVELDKFTSLRTTRLLKRIYRPDGKLTHMGGKHQTLSNDHDFVEWSGNSYISEHNANDQLIMEARFRSRRFATYRAYEFNFTGVPTDLPVVKAFAYRPFPASGVTIVHVIWNGATKLAS